MSPAGPMSSRLGHMGPCAHGPKCQGPVPLPRFGYRLPCQVLAVPTCAVPSPCVPILSVACQECPCQCVRTRSCHAPSAISCNVFCKEGHLTDRLRLLVDIFDLNKDTSMGAWAYWAESLLISAANAGQGVQQQPSLSLSLEAKIPCRPGERQKQGC